MASIRSEEKKNNRPSRLPPSEHPTFILTMTFLFHLPASHFIPTRSSWLTSPELRCQVTKTESTPSPTVVLKLNYHTTKLLLPFVVIVLYCSVCLFVPLISLACRQYVYRYTCSLSLMTCKQTLIISSPSLISLTVSVDVKYHVYLLTLAVIMIFEQRELAFVRPLPSVLLPHICSRTTSDATSCVL